MVYPSGQAALPALQVHSAGFQYPQGCHRKFSVPDTPRINILEHSACARNLIWIVTSELNWNIFWIRKMQTRIESNTFLCYGKYRADLKTWNQMIILFFSKSLSQGAGGDSGTQCCPFPRYFKGMKYVRSDLFKRPFMEKFNWIQIIKHGNGSYFSSMHGLTRPSKQCKSLIWIMNHGHHDIW